MRPSTRDSLLSMLRRHEGFVGHAYQDHLGYWTIGYGRLIDERRGGGISRDEGEFLLNNDVQAVIEQLNDHLPWWAHLDQARQTALVNMAFQLGVDGLLQFRNTLHLLQNERWKHAAREALNSRWATQTPRRAHEIAEILRTGTLR